MEDPAPRLYTGGPPFLQRSDSPMPTYEYTCKRCGETFETFQSFSAKPLRKHAECGGDLQKVFHARGVVFKGSGFYSTDSRSSASSSSNKGDSNKGDSNKGDSSKGDSTTKKTESVAGKGDTKSEKSSSAGAKPSSGGAPASE